MSIPSSHRHVYTDYMLVKLRGNLEEVDAGRVVIDVHGLGYEVQIPLSSVHSLPAIGEPLVLHTRQIFRENEQFLVGFIHTDDRLVFDLLTEVKGCGPKVSLQVISDLGAEVTLEAIAQENPRKLAEASGVGPRMAERIIVELKTKVRDLNLTRLVSRPNLAAVRPVGIDPQLDELVEALMALGYKKAEAESAAILVEEQEAPLETRLRLALRGLAR